jgi:sugar phosphate isomerase/epimerase
MDVRIPQFKRRIFTMKLGLNANTFAASDNLEGVCKLANEFGIKHLELWATNLEETKESINKFAFKGRDIKKAKKIIDNHGLRVCCITFGCGLDRQFVNSPQLFSDEFVRAVDIAAELGAEVINHYMDEIHPYPNIDFAYLERFWKAPINHAEDLGIVLALENEAHDVTQSPLNMLELINHFNSRSFKTNFDATNYFQASNEPFPYSYEILKEHIAYVHIKNGCKYNPEFCKDKEWLGGKLSRENTGGYIYYLEAKSGAVNIDGLLNRLWDDGYEGYCSLEPHTTRQRAIDCIHKEVAYLRAKPMFAE